LPYKYLIVVLGPTAVGKSECCIQLAQHFRTDIISADSRQFYQGMGIGTAQPTPEQRRAITHHFVDFLPIQATYSAGQFEKDALTKLSYLFQNHSHVILTGGSGLYLKAVCQGLAEVPFVDTSIRKQLINQLQQIGLAKLVKELAIKDPAYYAQVDLHNPQRVIRALEVCIATGQPYSSFQAPPATPRPFKTIQIGLWRERAELYQRINRRVDEMIEQGLVQEATALYPYRQYNALQTVGYQEVFNYLAGRYDLEEAIRLIKRNTRRYAKRQLTWFRADPTIFWAHPDECMRIVNYISQQTENKKY
jgi:tRNA dimethylallyltransferase